MLHIKSEGYITEKGRYTLNEDTLLFIRGVLYMICDGVGGNGNGQVASQLVSNSTAALLKVEPDLNLATLLQQVEEQINKHKKKYPSTTTMASTIAFMQISTTTIRIAWIGDTTIYQIRNGKIIYKSISHTWIQEAINKGEITELESYFHPNQNQVTRYIKGSEYPVSFDSFICTDIQENDFFMICSDGIQESWIDSDLETLFVSDKNAKEVIKKIQEQCAIFSTDNYSAIVIQVGV
jgi:serine/threonine protein phosphatase PrpC